MRRREFYWDGWNRAHIPKHSVSQAEAEEVVRHAKPPYPRKSGEGKFTVWGPTPTGRLLQVIYVHKQISEINFEELTREQILALEDTVLPLAYIIHARELTAREKSNYRRSQ
jgi:uncharacterized DUF497 family protein